METLEQKVKRLIGDGINPKDWHLHPNGDGLVCKNAYVSKNALITGNAIVFDGMIHGGMIHGGKIYGGMIRGGEIYGGEIYGGKIHGGEIRGGKIYDGEIYGGAIYETPLLIYGSKHKMYLAKPKYLSIGCFAKTFNWWRKNYEKVAKREGYSKKQIEEYKQYFKLFEERYEKGK